MTTILTFSLAGLEVSPVWVEVTRGLGTPRFTLAGIPEASVRESRVRVRAALLHAGVELDDLDIAIKLLPPDVKRSGGAFDLALAVGVLVAVGRIPATALSGTAFLGELSLSGEIKHVPLGQGDDPECGGLKPLASPTKGLPRVGAQGQSPDALT